MSKNIKFRISFINHLNEEINLNDFIVSVEQGSLIYEINKGYVNLDFVTNKVYYDPSIIGDDIERVKVKWQINDDEIQTELFCVEAVDYLKDNNIKVYCRSNTFKYAKYYINRIITADTLKGILSSLFSDFAFLNMDGLTDLKFKGSLDIENKTTMEVVEELRNLYKFDYYYQTGVLYFEDKKTISKEDTAIAKFNEIKNIEDFNTSTELFKKRVKKILFNPRKEENIDQNEENHNILRLEIAKEPQPCSPDETLSYTADDGTIYKIGKELNTLHIYFAPNVGYTQPVANFPTKKITKKIFEKYILNNEDRLEVTGNISSIVALSGADVYNYNSGTNVITFNEKISGEIKVTYESVVYQATLESSKYPKTIPLKVTFLDRVINYNHEYVLDGYYPLPYDLTLNVISDCGFGDLTGKSVTISKYDSSSKAFVENNGMDTNVDDFDEFTIHLTEYGTYKIEIDGADEPVFLDYFVNREEIYKTEKGC